jgi:hypothetical protein
MEANNTLIDNNETKAPSAINIAFKWALVSFLLYVIQTMVSMYLNEGEYNPRAGGWLQMLLGIVILFFPLTMAVKEYRDKEMDGYISFGRAFKTGFIYALITSALTLLFMIVFYNFIIDFDTFVANQVDISVKLLKERGMSDAEISKTLSNSPAFVSQQWFSLIMVFVGTLTFNTIADLIVSAILKRNNPNA